METSSDKVSLIWEDFQENVSKNFSDLRDDSDFSDVTLVCEDNQQVAAHRLVLSSCSPLLLSVLRSLRQPQPLIYFWGVRMVQLEAVLDFCYRGQVSVNTLELDDFIRVAKMLGIKGISEGDTVEDECDISRYQNMNIAMESPILPVKDMKIESILDNKETNITENAHDREVDDTEGKHAVVPMSKINEYFTVHETDQNIAKCNKCGKIVRSYLREINRTKFSQKFMRDHLRVHKVEFEQFILIQRKMKLDKKQKFCEDLENIRRKMSVEYGPLIIKEVQKEENSEIEVEIQKAIKDKIIQKEDFELLPEKRSKNEFKCKFSNCGFIANHISKMKRHEENKHERQNIPILCTRSFCTKTFDTLPEFHKHRELCFLKCSWKQCGKEFKDGDGYKGHQRVHPHGTKEELQNIHSKPSNTNIHQNLLSKEDAKNKLKGIWDNIQCKQNGQ